MWRRKLAEVLRFLFSIDFLLLLRSVPFFGFGVSWQNKKLKYQMKGFMIERKIAFCVGPLRVLAGWWEKAEDGKAAAKLFVVVYCKVSSRWIEREKEREREKRKLTIWNIQFWWETICGIFKPKQVSYTHTNRHTKNNTHTFYHEPQIAQQYNTRPPHSSHNKK